MGGDDDVSMWPSFGSNLQGTGRFRDLFDLVPSDERTQKKMSEHTKRYFMSPPLSVPSCEPQRDNLCGAVTGRPQKQNNDEGQKITSTGFSGRNRPILGIVEKPLETDTDAMSEASTDKRSRRPSPLVTPEPAMPTASVRDITFRSGLVFGYSLLPPV